MPDPHGLLRAYYASESEFVSALKSARMTAQELAEHHALTLGEPLHGASTSFVIAAGSEHVIKVVLVGEEAESGVAFLKLAQGRGVVEVIDQRRNAILMPRLNPGTDISKAPTQEAIMIFCHHANLFRALPVIEELATAESVFSSAELENPNLVRMLESTKDVSALHGDLHHFNIVYHGSQTVVIDPKGLIGDPCMEAAAFLRNPIPQPKDIDLGDAIERIADSCDLNPNRIWGWARAITELCAEESGPLAADFALAAHRIARLSNRFWV